MSIRITRSNDGENTFTAVEVTWRNRSFFSGHRKYFSLSTENDHSVTI